LGNCKDSTQKMEFASEMDRSTVGILVSSGRPFSGCRGSLFWQLAQNEANRLP